MNVLPDSYANGLIVEERKEAEKPTKTWAFQLDGNRCVGTCDDANALIQTAYAILQTERGVHLIYPPDYGLQMDDLRGRPASFVFAMLQTRVREALMYDKRITDVTDFEYDTSGDSMTLRYVMHTTLPEKTIKGAYYVR